MRHLSICANGCSDGLIMNYFVTRIRYCMNCADSLSSLSIVSGGLTVNDDHIYLCVYACRCACTRDGKKKYVQLKRAFMFSPMKNAKHSYATRV